jgi:hypothetical protein
MMKCIRIIEVELDKQLLAFPLVSQFTHVDVNITPVRCDDQWQSSRHLGDVVAVAVHSFHVQLLVHRPEEHHFTNATREATP